MLILIDCKQDGVVDALSSGAKASGATALRWPTDRARLPESDGFLLISDGDTPALMRHAADLRACHIEPKRTLVRAHEPKVCLWTYHDLPLFASITAPHTEEEAVAAIRRLSKARAYGPTAPASSAAPDASMAQLETRDFGSEADRLAAIAAESDLKVLLVGETGTGKNTFAERIHTNSGLAGAFVSLNCSALPETLIESELFGVEAGAYTGAQRSRPGRFELADGGTLFLDEIDSLPIHLQTKLLSAIQDSGTTRLGDHRFRPSRFRLITATQTPLGRLVAEGRFRADLMHRVSVIEIHLPPVRQLGSQLIATFESMLACERTRLNMPHAPIEPSLYVTLLSHDWPGNFRELAAAAQRVAIGLPPIGFGAPRPVRRGLREQMGELERILVQRALAFRGGNLRAASEDLDLPLETFRYRIRKLGLTE